MRDIAGFSRAAFGLVAAWAAVVCLSGCSDPDPGITAEEFYARAAETRSRALASGENGWDAFEGVLGEFREFSDKADGAYRDDEALSPDAWPSMQIEAICFGPFPREGLGTGLDTLAALRASGILGRLDAALGAGVIAQAWDTSLPVYQGFNDGLQAAGMCRGLSRALRADARVAASEGDSGRVVADFRRELGIARAVSGRCLSIDYLMGAATVTMAMQDARHLAMEGALSPEAIRGLLEVFDGARALPPADAVIDTERDFCLATFVDSAAERGIRVHRERWLREIEDAHAGARKLAGDPGRGPAAEMGGDEFFAAVLSGSTDEDDSLGLVRHSFAMALDNERRVRFDLAGTRAVLLVALYRAEHGEFPASLEGLGAPVDPVSGKAFVYRVTPETPGAPFLLYSLGADGVDNGGAEAEGGMMSPPGPDDAGFDCVFTKPRRGYVGMGDLIPRAPDDE